MVLRPDLEAARAKLYKQLSTTVEMPGANTSYLIIGARGTGKTLVRLIHLPWSLAHRTHAPVAIAPLAWPLCLKDMHMGTCPSSSVGP